MKKSSLILWGIGFNALAITIGFMGYFLLSEVLFKEALWKFFFKYGWT